MYICEDEWVHGAVCQGPCRTQYEGSRSVTVAVLMFSCGGSWLWSLMSTSPEDWPRCSVLCWWGMSLWLNVLLIFARLSWKIAGRLFPDSVQLHPLPFATTSRSPSTLPDTALAFLTSYSSVRWHPLCWCYSPSQTRLLEHLPQHNAHIGQG